jgi:diguanylate cyclase (GGDEF)-like protein/PAS domain S-box-containing protein
VSKKKSHSLHDAEGLRELVRRLKEGIYITDQRGGILDANPAFVRMLGGDSLDELRGRNIQEFLLDPSARRHEHEVLDREGSVREFELQIQRPDGPVATVIDTAYASHDAETGEIVYHGILVDITDRKQLEHQLLEQATRDPLTGCYNRRFLDDFESRMDDQPWGCIMIDIDRFKNYNDLYGHQAGDKVLVWMSRFLMRQTRAEEAVVRVGGDEFLVVLGGADVARTESAAKRLETVAETEAPVPFSMGWAAREEEESLEKTIGRADQKLLAVRVEKRGPEKDRRERL